MRVEGGQILEYVWTRTIGAKRPVSPFFESPQEAGQWLRSGEGRAHCAGMMFGPTLRVRVDYDNMKIRDARRDEWTQARASTSSV